MEDCVRSIKAVIVNMLTVPLAISYLMCSREKGGRATGSMRKPASLESGALNGRSRGMKTNLKKNASCFIRFVVKTPGSKLGWMGSFDVVYGAVV